MATQQLAATTNILFWPNHEKGQRTYSVRWPDKCGLYPGLFTGV